ncbi:hypothetical protein BN1723_020366, partial [Verticillium longisporum]
RLQRWPP